MQEKQDENIRERLCGKRILALGPESDMKRKFLQVFRNEDPEISEDAGDMSQEDYVILFGFSDTVSFGWEMFSLLTRILCRIEDVRPKSVLFVSRADVYGKLFGKFHPVKEDEMGYVCHTDMRDQETARLRMLENFCFRMAREEGIGIKIARFPDMRAGRGSGEPGWQNDKAESEKEERPKSGEYGWQDTGRSQKRRNTAGNVTPCQDWKRIVGLAVKILLDGAPGEVYNVDGTLWAKDISESDLTAFADTTALEPIRIVMDTGKAGKLG